MALMTQEIYAPDGTVRTLADPGEAVRELRERGGTAWIALEKSEQASLGELARELQLPQLAVEDALHGEQVPKLDVYEQVSFLALRIPSSSGVTELHVFTGPGFIITVNHGAPDRHHWLRRTVRSRLGPDGLSVSPATITYAIVDAVVDSYEPVLDEVAETIDALEEDVFAGAPGTARKLHEHFREVLRLQRAVHQLVALTEELIQRSRELEGHFRDVHDNAVRLVNHTDSFRDILSSAMQLHVALVGQRQNEEMARMTQAAFNQGEQAKKVASWAAILFTPTVIAGIYGMNFANMPELGTRFGYPVALLAMLTAAVTLFVVFKRQKWL